MVAVVERYVDVNFTDEANELSDLRKQAILLGAKDDRGDWLMGARPDFGAAGLTLIDESQYASIIKRKDDEKSWISEYITRIFNQNGDPSCFPPGALVTMATGEQRPIEDVRCLESVVTAEGRTGEVRQVMVKPYIGQIVNVHLHGHNFLRCTPEHPILTNHGYVAAKDLTANHWVAIPKVAPVATQVIQTAAHLPEKHRCRNELRSRGFNSVAGRSKTTVSIQAVPDTLTLDADLGKILGYFLSEGGTGKNTITWTFCHSELETLVADLRRLLKERLGIESKLSVNTSRSTAKVMVYGALWSRLFESLCATGSGCKRLHPDIASGPPEFLKAVFDGWMAGDGYRGQRRNVGVTVSRQLAVQMFQVATRLGLSPSIRRSEPKPNKHASSRLPRYDVSYGKAEGEAEDDWRRRQDGTHLWRKVRLMTLEDYKGPVYNLHVHGDESYVADGIGVHNCVTNAFLQAHQIAQSIAVGKDRVINMAVSSVYPQVGNRVSGSSLSSNLRVLTNWGAIPLDDDRNRKLVTAGHIKHVMPANGFPSLPSGAADTAGMFKILEVIDIRNYREACSALMQNWAVVYARSGHCILAVRVFLSNGVLRFGYVNSWGQWGAKLNEVFNYGMGYDSANVFRAASSWCVAVRLCTIPDFQYAMAA